MYYLLNKVLLVVLKNIVYMHRFVVKMNRDSRSGFLEINFYLQAVTNAK